jgi:hypothetical protein
MMKGREYEGDEEYGEWSGFLVFLVFPVSRELK